MMKLHVADKYPLEDGWVGLTAVYISPLHIVAVKECEVPQSVTFTYTASGHKYRTNGKERGSLVFTTGYESNESGLAFFVVETPEQIVELWK